ncbi:MAG: hypothetical protein COZ31_04810 [Nitrospirae bacterium CG_4_10_14_3_um_filter_44_29]|nr:type I restriction enzyme HsdR N-terminal domain-containing protein [Nitrospirota bacterium]OIO27792.1 MAG: hypothetical protein AUJ60_08560 [Nitrospirae bacterium CG1_02_44_142]PIP70322.1 MAG: hypothetical protein COW90_05960 [Nitrospirae bacterium CG22_combo_CG10-13_8_21_14_all_44_11]PIV67317.1 MAG: hypothetical protein COS10_01650 [Nitrospirae bacterium CG01_land_8_20_14_3_00_44_22]PIX88917.1 MAG: hypothetical protein COZ31_04810 [Nitrospirae bacterium CG_4_10_14_3_um_filter_44_29]PJA819
MNGVEEKLIDFITGREIVDTTDERVRQGIERFLIEEKGYTKDDIEVDRGFDVVLDEKTNRAKVDLVISLEGKRFMIIKCIGGSLSSWEREALACARIFDTYVIPLAVVTDGEDAEILDAATGKAIGHGPREIPSRHEALEAVKRIEFKGLSGDKREKEKRVFWAFESIKSEECGFHPQ